MTSRFNELGRLRALIAIIAILPMFILAGCSQNDGNQVTNPSPTPTPDDPLTKMGKQRAAHIMKQTGNSDERQVPTTSLMTAISGRVKPDNLSSSELTSWQGQINAASSSVTDAEIAVRYNLLCWAFDTQTDQQLAYLLPRISGTPTDLEVTLTRVTPAQRTALWNRLPISRVNNIMTYIPSTTDRSNLAWYLNELNQIGLAPATSVPYNLI